MSACKPEKYDIRTFVVATGKRDTAKYPHPSQFVYDLPITLSKVFGVSIRDYQFGTETLINENNKGIVVSGISGGTPFSKTVNLTVGAYNNTLSTVLSAINTAMTGASVLATFSLDTATDRVKVVLAGGPINGDYVFVSGTASFLRILGFESTGLLVYKTTAPAGVGAAATTAETAVGVFAPNRYDVYNLSEMVVRIAELEALLSNDAVTNRSTAILFNANSNNYTVRQAQDHYIPLLQTQHRVQRLHIELRNMEGDLYDTINNEAVFILEVYCEHNVAP